MREFKPVLRIGNGPWFAPCRPCKTYADAKARADMFAKWWLGVAESDVEESESIVKRESLKALKLKHRKHLNCKEESNVQRTLLSV